MCWRTGESPCMGNLPSCGKTRRSRRRISAPATDWRIPGPGKTGNGRVADKTLAEFETIMNEFNAPQPRRPDEAAPAHQRPGLPEGAGADAPQPRQAQGYAGDVSPQLACQWWQQGDAVLI